jgi:hypothetical protein
LFHQSSIQASKSSDNSNERQFNPETIQNGQLSLTEETNELIDTDSEEKEDLFELKIGLTFTNWAEFKIWIENFAKKKGFSYKVRTSRMDGEVIRNITYECSRSGAHNPQVSCDPTKRRNATSQRTQCPWKLNVAYPKSSNIVKINSFVDNHNHTLTSSIQEIAPRFRKLTTEMLADIEKYVIQGRMDSGSIYPLLQHDYPNHTIYKKDLYNAVYKFRAKNNPGDSDASQMLQMLLNWKDSDPLWIVKPRLEPSSRKLNHLLWISPSQRDLYERFHDVVILDTTSNTNRFRMMLCVIAIIDNHFKTRIVASAIIEDETLDTFRWILMTLFEETGIYPRVIFTDSDPSLISAIKEIYPNTNHLLCIFHIDLNLRKKLKGKLGVRFEEFRQKFYACRNSLCKELFEFRWMQLVDQYPESAKYMTETLYVSKDSWAISWIRNQFTGGVQSTQRIESINKQIHDKVDRSTSLCDLVVNINDCVKGEERFEKFEIERNALPTIGLPMLCNRLFGRVDDIIKQYLTPIMLGKQRLEMNQSVCYDINRIMDWHQLLEVS